MIVYPHLPSGFTVFCDDLRQEINSKITFVGTYGDTMLVNGLLPAILPTFAMMIVYREEPESLEPVEIKIFMPGHDYDSPAQTFQIDPQADLIPPDTGEFLMREARFYWRVPGLVIEQEGQIRVRAFRGDQEIRLGALQVTVNEEVRAAAEADAEKGANPSDEAGLSEPLGP
jgi:hypothetical protein